MIVLFLVCCSGVPNGRTPPSDWLLLRKLSFDWLQKEETFL